jgi:hypothetical protein
MSASKSSVFFGLVVLAATCLANCGGDGDGDDDPSGSGGSSGANSGGGTSKGGSGDGGTATGSAGDDGDGGTGDPAGGSDPGGGGDAAGGDAAGGEAAGGSGSGGAPGGGICGLPQPVGSCDDRENVFPTCVEYYQVDPVAGQYACEQVDTRTWTTGQGCTSEGLAGVCTFGTSDSPFQSNFYYEEDPARPQGCEDNDGTWCEP